MSNPSLNAPDINPAAEIDPADIVDTQAKVAVSVEPQTATEVAPHILIIAKLVMQLRKSANGQ